MAWVRLEDTFPEHPKVDKAGGDAGWLHVCALAYCNRNETDGVIPADRLVRLSDRRNPKVLAAKLVDAGLWELHAEGWMIHDYLHYQPSKAQREKERAEARERMRTARASKGSGNVRANIDRSSDNPDPTRPDPHEHVSVNSTPENTGGAVDISRRSEVLDAYCDLAAETAEGKGIEIVSYTGYRKTARKTGDAHPDLNRWLDLFPTAPAGAVAAWMTGDTHSMSYHPRSDELATVHQLHEGIA